VHVPDGFLDLQTSVGTAVVATAAVAVALRQARRQLDDRTAPLAGLVATFLFAAQMITFPVGAATSGHLLGGALAAVLVGPWMGMLCVTVVLVVQSLLFADGGITALGTNVVLLALVATLGGWLVCRAGQSVLPDRPSMVVPAAALGAFVSVPLAALGFVGLYAVGGTVGVPLETLGAAMLGVHTVIGVGEAVITWGVVASVVAVRPDLVYAARPAVRDRDLLIRSSL
jgi:cobalt/nickel transport system permease protein